MSDTGTKEYELIYIVRPNLDDESIDRTVNGVEDFITNNGGTIVATDKKGRKRLAYEVKKMRDGFYVLSQIRLPSTAVAPLKRMMTLSEDIIRFLVVTQPPVSEMTESEYAKAGDDR